jgi:hypothetical protein
VLNELERLEIRFEPAERPRPGGSKAQMRILRTPDGGNTWEEIPIKLVWWDAIRYLGLWPPDPIDVLWFRAEGTQLEVSISDLKSNPSSDGNSSWKATYVPQKQRWEIAPHER